MKCRTINVLAVAMLSAPVLGIEAPFDVPWIGYDTAVYPEGIFPVASQSADFNSDGVPDLATVSYGGTSWMSILFGDGEGGYLPPETYPLIIESADLAVADFDGDKDLDIVTTDTGRFLEGISVSLYRNDGTGSFTFAGWTPIGDVGPFGITTADFNGDGWPDVATANEDYIVCNNTVSVLLNANGSGFSSPQVYSISSCTHEITSGDLTGDGAPELVVAHTTNVFTVMNNDGSGTFIAQSPTPGINAGPIPAGPVVHLADIDLDGDNDVFFSNLGAGGINAGAIGLWRNDGTGSLGLPETLSFNWHNSGAIDIDTADVTGDGWPDILCATGSSGNWFLFESLGEGVLDQPRKLRAGHSPSAIDTPDLDLDGDIDVMILGSASLAACVYLNPGDGAFVQPDPMDMVPSSYAPAFTTNIEVGDIDFDGDLDVVVGYRSDFENQFGISIRRNNGDGTFAEPELYDHFTYPIFVRLHDLDMDDDLDLIWNEPDGRFRMRYNDGAGNFGSFVNSTIVGGEFFDLYDVDNDIDPDVVVASGFDVAVLKNTGIGTFAAPQYTSIGGFFNVLDLGDFNGDGNLDVLTDSAPQGYPQISFGDGTGSFGPTFTVSTGRDVHSFVVGYIDDDVNLDFAAIYNLDEKGVSIRRGHGDGNFLLANHYHGSFQWDDYTTGGRTSMVDVNQDSAPDLLFANVKAQDFSYWQGHGDGTFDRVRRFGTGHEVHDLYAADFTGDGFTDVIMACQIDDGGWWHTGIVLIKGVAPTPQVPGDLNGDGVVNTADLLILLSEWGACAGCPSDLDGDGDVDTADLLILLGNWS